MLAFIFLWVFVCGVADRVRGSDFNIISRTVDRVLYALILAIGPSLILGDYSLATFFCLAVAMYVGMVFGWGNPLKAAITEMPMESNYERWQVGILRKNVYLALAVRGFIWGIFVLPVYALATYLDSGKDLQNLDYFKNTYMLSYILAFTIAMPLSVKFKNVKIPYEKDPWGRVECFRGWLASAIVAAIVYGYKTI
jgi:hypothetical protein